jgi:hypothetical protein
LVKKDGSLRPIACGDVWRRLSARCVCKEFSARFLEALSPHQFGVAVKGGSEVLVHAARLLYEGAQGQPDFFLLKFDFRNAFNCVSRQAFLDEVAAKFPTLLPFVSLCYGASSALQFGERQLSSTSGVQQGHFCFAWRSTLFSRGSRRSVPIWRLTLGTWMMGPSLVLATTYFGRYASSRRLALRVVFT